MRTPPSSATTVSDTFLASSTASVAREVAACEGQMVELDRGAARSRCERQRTVRDEGGGRQVLSHVVILPGNDLVLLSKQQASVALGNGLRASRSDIAPR